MKNIPDIKNDNNDFPWLEEKMKINGIFKLLPKIND